MGKIKNLRIAIVTDWLTNQGGAEQVILALSKTFPKSPIYTSVYNAKKLPQFKNHDIRCTYLQKLPSFLRKKHQFLLPFLPGAFASLDLSEFDIIISSCSAFSKNITKTSQQKHFCYCHSPVRYLYNEKSRYLSSYSLPFWLKPAKLILPLMLKWLEKKDQKSLASVDFFISNSNFIKERIKKFYKREATTIYPCIDIKEVKETSSKRSYFLSIGRFIPYKRFDIIIKAFAKNKLPLKLGGIGPELKKYKKLAQDLNATNIEFLGFVSQEEIFKLYQNARAFIFPTEEDFGLTPVEAMSMGTPVIAYKGGGATESVTLKSGVFFEFQTVESLEAGVQEFIKNEQNFCSKEIKAQAQKFDISCFEKNIIHFIEKNI